jgi:hypothetical protein
MPPKNSHPEILYHYTTQQGLLGILEKKAIWATNLHYLNDPSEFNHPISLAKKNIYNKIKLLTGELDVLNRGTGLLNPRPLEIKKELTDLDAILELLDSQRHIPIYICSFSQEGDQLGQWRGYCHNESGFSIGFDYKRLQKLASEQGFALKQCIYEPEKQSVIIEDLVEKLRKVTPPQNARIVSLDQLAAIMPFWSIAPTLKHDSFKEEFEWRLISEAFGSKKKEETFFKQGKSMIIPYEDFSLGSDLPIEEIIVGPTPNKDLALQSVALFTEKHKKNVKIISSKGPYRNW